MSNSAEMPAVQTLRAFVNQRLTAAAEEILGVFEQTLVVYEEEIERQRRQLDVVLKPEIKLHRIDPPPPFVCKEELLLDQQQETVSSLGQEVPELSQIKEEQDELSQEGEQLLEQEAVEVQVQVQDVLKLTPASEGSDHSEHQTLHSDPYQTESAAEEEPEANVSFKLTQSEGDGAGPRVSEPNSNRLRRSHNRHVAASEGYKPFSRGNAGSTQSTGPKQQNRAHKCDSCSKEFSDMKRLKTHMRIHTATQHVRCDTCCRVFSKRSNLLKHMRTHAVCGKQLLNRANYKHHLMIHKGERPHICDTCGKKFLGRGDLKKHIRVHTGEKPYKCHVCGRGFPTSSKLTVHTRTHTGEKPYKCGTCGKAFCQNGNMKRHMLTHTGEKPYKCSTCGKCFSKTTDLKRHKILHISQFPSLGSIK